MSDIERCFTLYGSYGCFSCPQEMLDELGLHRVETGQLRSRSPALTAGDRSAGAAASLCSPIRRWRPGDSCRRTIGAVSR